MGDAGITEASRKSHRYGLEWSNRYFPTEWLSLNADFSVSRARYLDEDPVGNLIPGSVEKVGLISANVNQGKWSGGLQWRYIGSRPLIEDGSIFSSASSLLNGRIKYQINQKTDLRLDMFNLLNTQADDISYYYPYQISPSSSATSGIAFHPAEPRTFRVSITQRF